MLCFDMGIKTLSYFSKLDYNIDISKKVGNEHSLGRFSILSHEEV